MSAALSVKDFCLEVQVDVEVVRCFLVFIFKKLNETVRIDKCVGERFVDGFTSLRTV
jgi:hypothetical protein